VRRVAAAGGQWLGAAAGRCDRARRVAVAGERRRQLEANVCVRERERE
jgi:hypothetical protein